MNIAHLHLALNHLPVVGVPFALGLYLIGSSKKNTELIKTSYQFFLIAALAAVVAYFSGSGAEEVVEKLSGFSEGLVEKHEEMAQLALGTTLLVGVLAAVSLYLIRVSKPTPPVLKIIFLFLVLLATGLMAWTANLGGQIRHDEIRNLEINNPAQDS